MLDKYFKIILMFFILLGYSCYSNSSSMSSSHDKDMDISDEDTDELSFKKPPRVKKKKSVKNQDAFYSSELDNIIPSEESFSDLDTEGSDTNTTPSSDIYSDSIEESVAVDTSLPTMISWISFDYNLQESRMTIELDYDNPPSFVSKLVPDKSPFDTKDLIFTFSNTKCKPNLFHVINTAAFASSIKNIRLKKQDKNTTNLIIKLKDDISYTKEIDQKYLKLHFPILDKYKNLPSSLNLEPTSKPIEKADSLTPIFGNATLDKLDRLFKEYGSSIDTRSSKSIYITQVAQASSEDIVSPSTGSSNVVTPNEDQSSTQNTNTPTLESKSIDPPTPPGEQSTTQLGDDPLDRMGEVDPMTSRGNIVDSKDDNNSAGIQTGSTVTYTKNDILGEGLEDKDYNKYVGEAVEIEFYSTPLRQVLQTFADQSGNNFIFSKDIGQELITIKLSKVPWDAALAAILETYKLVMSRIGDNIIRIDSIDRMADYFSSKEKITDAKLLAEKNKILVMKLSNAKADDIKARMAELLITQGLARKIKISTDSRTNALILEAPELILSKAKLIVERLDVPIPQVEIASKLIEVNRSASNELGITWQGNLNYSALNGMDFGSLKFPNSVRAPFMIDAGASAVGTSNAIDFMIGSLNDVVNLDLTLKIGENKGTTEVLQSNKVLVKDRESATISTGNTDYFNISTADKNGDLTPSLTSVSYNLSLNVTPELTTDGKVGLQLDISSTTPSAGAASQVVTSTNNRSLTTKLIKKSGETAVIGGLYDNKKTFQEWKLPVISSIPIIGSLFRGKQQTETHTELMILITPTIKTIEGVSIVGDQRIPEAKFPDTDDPVNISLKTSTDDEDDDSYDDDDDDDDSVRPVSKKPTMANQVQPSSQSEVQGVEQAQSLAPQKLTNGGVEENLQIDDLLEEEED